MDACVTFLVPVREQKLEFLEEAIDSVAGQTSPRWRMCLVTHRQTSPRVVETVKRRVPSSQLDLCVTHEDHYAGALNRGLRSCRTSFVALLLSDDRLSAQAAEVLEHWIARDPKVDFFYSARSIIDGGGTVRSAPLLPYPAVTRERFARHGSPVKHLMCWRVAPALRLGGFDPDLSVHGCDDYDFPWRMFEAGCHFRAIPECLYQYRIHREAFRLTTGIPVDTQIATLRRMFRKHSVEEPLIDAYIARAEKEYLYADHAAELEAILRDVGQP